MTRQAILAVVIGAIIVLGAAAAFLYSKTQQTEEAPQASVAQDERNENGMMAGTLVDLLRNQENVRCTFASSTEVGDTSGTIYVSGENMRGDFELTTEDETEASHMIRTGDTFYMWGDSFSTGIRMVMNVDEWAQSAQDARPTEAAQTFDPNEQVDFECAGWTVDSSMFDTPTDVEFISFEGMMGPNEAMTQDSVAPGTSNETSTPDQCSICNSLTGDARNVCLQQFNCQ